MTSKTRSLREFRNPIGCLILLAAFSAAAGCSTAESPAGSGNNMNHVLPSGSSVSGWLVTPSGGNHTSSATLDYLANNGSSGCAQCHGSDLKGGISGVSCFGNPAGCHHGPVPNWATPAGHGAAAKKAPGSSGFASCQICHGSNFSGGATVSCFICHGVSAPHPPRPWRGTPYTHADTNTANAPVCAQCHYPNSPNNPANHPATPAPAGTAPGCFNNTLCHGEGGVPHPVDNAWVTTSPAPQPHGISAKAAPGTTSGFAYCKVCHGTGTNFAGGTSGQSCYPCHLPTANSPHASQWRTGDPYVHTNTDPGNADVCAYCHLNGANSPIAAPSPPASAGTAPGCFNSTLCHGAGVHPAGWSQSSQHGPAAKAVPTASAGFFYCQGCHGTGTNFAGGTSGQSCYPCHLPTANSPHASQWRTGDPLVHTTTATGNAAVCAYCHLNGANSPIAPPSPPAPAGTAPGCFNSTLCHGSGGVAHPVPYNDPSHYAVTSATFPGSCSACHDVSTPSTKSGPVCQTCHVASSPLTALNCTSCHASPPNGGAPAGTAYPNIEGAHAEHIALTSAGTPITCDTCHSGLGSGTLAHYNAASPPRVEPGDVAFPAGFLYAGVTGTGVTFDNALATLTCSNVSCHGALVTPNWRTGATTCTSCHNSATVAPAFYTDYTQTFITHNQHINRTGCTTCHTNLPAGTHFGTLSDKAIPSRAAAATINPNFAYPSPPPSGPNENNCNTNSVGGCH